LDGPLPKLCPAVALSRQDGHHSAVVLLLKAALIQTLFEVNVFYPCHSNKKIQQSMSYATFIVHFIFTMHVYQVFFHVYHNFTIQVFTCNVCRLLACVAYCIQTDVESGQSSFPDNLVTEWNEFFSEGIYGVLLHDRHYM
jgi:hypothetical protein